MILKRVILVKYREIIWDDTTQREINLTNSAIKIVFTYWWLHDYYLPQTGIKSNSLQLHFYFHILEHCEP